MPHPCSAGGRDLRTEGRSDLRGRVRRETCTPPVTERNSFPRSAQLRGPAQVPNQQQTSFRELRCFWCHKVDHKKTQRYSAAKPLCLVSVEQRPEEELGGYEGFTSVGSLPGFK